LSTFGRAPIPAVVGEIAAGIVIGKTGLDLIDTGNAVLVFLADIGFAMLMFSVGMRVPLHDSRLRASLGRGAIAAGVAALLAVGAGFAASAIPGAGHPLVFGVLIASGSAAVVVPIVQERGLTGPTALTIIAQVTVADVGATIAVPFVLRPSRAADVASGAALIAACVALLLLLSRAVSGTRWVHRVRREGKRRHWAVDLRVALLVLFGLAWIAERTGASLLVAGFGAGLMVAAIGGPKRLSTEVLGIGEGFFIPLFFVVLGARINLRGVFQHPAMLGLALGVAALTAAVHVAAAIATRQPSASGLVSSAQLGVPAAIVALGVPAHVITETQAAAIIAASVLSLGVCAAGAAALSRRQQRSGTGAAVPAPLRVRS
jgi:Kef-type K+ transport system membrane component KefB